MLKTAHTCTAADERAADKSGGDLAPAGLSHEKCPSPMNLDRPELRNPDTEPEFVKMYVQASSCVNFKDLDEEDREAVGVFEVFVPGHLSPSIAAATAMGAFHSSIPIRYLYCFEFDVYDKEGNLVDPDYDADWYELAAEHQAFVD